jgi:hypothetical protein
MKQFMEERARVIRSLADKADPFTSSHWLKNMNCGFEMASMATHKVNPQPSGDGAGDGGVQVMRK